MSAEHRHMPDANRLSVLLSAVLLSYALAQLVDRNQYFLTFRLLEIDFSIPFDLTLVTTLMSAGLTASGVDWLLRGHPHYDGRRTVQHWILPALTALVLSVPLYNFPPGPAWWLSFALGAVLLLLVLLAEYIALDPADVRHPAASAGLMALSFALFVILIYALSSAGMRLTVVILAAFPAAGLVTLRAIHLHSGHWNLPWAFTSAFVVTQFAAALHYWPLIPVQYGLVLLGPLYALTGLALKLHELVSWQRAALDALFGLAVFWIAALFLRG